MTKSDRTSVSIRAIGPTGDTWYTPHPQPIWKFDLTNAGTCEVFWKAGVEVRGGADENYSNAGGFVDWPEGTLAPGQGLQANMIVPAKTGSFWRATVGFWELPRSRTRDMKRYADEWH